MSQTTCGYQVEGPDVTWFILMLIEGRTQKAVMDLFAL